MPSTHSLNKYTPGQNGVRALLPSRRPFEQRRDRKEYAPSAPLATAHTLGPWAPAPPEPSIGPTSLRGPQAGPTCAATAGPPHARRRGHTRTHSHPATDTDGHRGTGGPRRATPHTQTQGPEAGTRTAAPRGGALTHTHTRPRYPNRRSHGRGESGPGLRGAPRDAETGGRVGRRPAPH